VSVTDRFAEGSASPRVGLVLGAGGLIGQAYHVGVLHAQEEAGVDGRDATTIVGTSAGSLTGALLRLGAAPSDLAAVLTEAPPSPQGAELVELLGSPDVELPPFAVTDLARPWHLPSRRLLRRFALRPWDLRLAAAAMTLLPSGRVDLRSLLDAFDDVADGWPSGLRICAARRDDGSRVVFDGSRDVTLADAVAASCAIPGYFAPVTIGRSQYFDGGVHSVTNADVLAGDELDLVLVTAPMSLHGRDRSAAGFLRRSTARRLTAEVALLRRRGLDVVRFEPGPEVRAAMGPNPMDPDRVAAVVQAACTEVRTRLADGLAERLAVARPVAA
jgi:NTE family protein